MQKYDFRHAQTIWNSPSGVLKTAVPVLREERRESGCSGLCGLVEMIKVSMRTNPFCCSFRSPAFAIAPATSRISVSPRKVWGTFQRWHRRDTPPPSGHPCTACSMCFCSRSFCCSSSAMPPRHSLLRHLIPFRLIGIGQSPAVLFRHALLHRKEVFIPSLLTSLESAPRTFPRTPLVLLAEAFQLVLEGGYPQRLLREAFEKAELACRRALLNLDVIERSYFALLMPCSTATNNSSDAENDFEGLLQRHEAEEREAWETVKISPLHRLWMFELQAAAAYYANVFSIPGSGSASISCYDVAAMAVQHIVAGDMRRDALLAETVLRWEESRVRRQFEEEEEGRAREASRGVRTLFYSFYHEWIQSSCLRWTKYFANGKSKPNCPGSNKRPYMFSLLHSIRNGLFFSPNPSTVLENCNTPSLTFSRHSWPLWCPRCDHLTGIPKKEREISDTHPRCLPHGDEGKAWEINIPQRCFQELGSTAIYQYARDTPILYTVFGDTFPDAAIGSSSNDDVGGGVEDSHNAQLWENAIARGYAYEEDDVVVRELLLLERDCFGSSRFDRRGEHRHLFHVLHLEEIGKNWSSASVLFHPVVRAFGGFRVACSPIANGRWIRFQVSCENDPEDDHRLLTGSAPSHKEDLQGQCERCGALSAKEGKKQLSTAESPEMRNRECKVSLTVFSPLPLFEEVRAYDDASESPPMGFTGANPVEIIQKPIIFSAHYEDPICPIRQTAGRRTNRQSQTHTEVFDLAVEQQHAGI